MKWFGSRDKHGEQQLLHERERIVLEVTESICDIMNSQGISRSELARRMQCSPAFITKLLAGDNNFTVQTLANAFAAIGKSIHFVYSPLGDKLRVPRQDAMYSHMAWSEPIENLTPPARSHTMQNVCSAENSWNLIDRDGDQPFIAA